MDSLIPTLIPERLYFRIGDVAEIAGVKTHVLRYWESEFSEIQPEKSSTGQRVYRRRDVETVLLIKHFLYSEKYSIEGARQKIRELRRGGELASYRKEVADPLPAPERLAREAALRQARSILSDVESLNTVPMRDIFKY
jgi:DNA-binding transcriptional MerR regulator